jgi:hypothetical protein
MVWYYVSLKNKGGAALLNRRKSNNLGIFQLSGDANASDHDFDANILRLQAS